MSKIIEIALAVLTLLPKAIEAIKAIEEAFSAVQVGELKREMIVGIITDAAEDLDEMDVGTMTKIINAMATRIIWFGKKIGVFTSSTPAIDAAEVPE